MGSNGNYDVIIIGAGSIGTPAAYFLADAGVKTLVLDKHASVGQGASKAAIGGIRATHSDVAKIRSCLKSIEIFSQWEEERGDNIEWYQGGYSFVAYREKEEKVLKELIKIQQSYDLDIQWLDKDAILEVVPDLNKDGLIGGTYSPGDGSASPLLAGYAFYRHGIEKGAKFNFNETVQEITQQSGKVKGVVTDKGKYEAPVVINAAGPGAKAIAQMVGIDVPVNPDSHEAGVTEPVAHFLEPMIVRHPSFGGLGQLLLLSAPYRSAHLLYHSRPAHRGDGPSRDLGVFAHDLAAYGGSDAQAQEHQGQAHLARALPHDS